MKQQGTMLRNGFCLLCLLTLFIPASSEAQEYPSQPINVVVNFPPGGSTDITTRTLASKAEKFLGQPLVIENIGGGGGTVGLGIAAKKPADGYHIVSCSSMGFTWHPLLRPLPYGFQDFVSIMNFVTSETGIVVKSNTPWKTVEDLMTYAKQNPGKVTYSTAGANSPAHVFTEYLGKTKGIQWTHIPHKGAAPAITALLGGHITFYNGGEEWAPHVKSGEFRLLVTLTPNRKKAYPETPTMRELGYDLVNFSRYLLVAPKGTPMPIIKKLEDAFSRAQQDPQYVQTIAKMDMELTHLGSAETEKYIIDSYNYHKKLLSELNLLGIAPN